MILVWLPSANVTRDAQLDYIARDSFLAAIDQDEKIERQVNILLDHPNMGRPGRVKTTRELVISGTSFIVTYRVKGKRIEILRVLHGSQQWPRNVREMLEM
ncbi:MAG: type II toxin-antitoxin system RelE/ParE family toxin [Nitrosospira sp.]|nr:type II toxin-antitoxin system RelE/ParE family toxin [Nitrosospira sp.]MDN5934621.1 type II toxin-antitoxin system RelE/ParE family toxin [Nitrosospira sp.]